MFQVLGVLGGQGGQFFFLFIYFWEGWVLGGRGGCFFGVFWEGDKTAGVFSRGAVNLFECRRESFFFKGTAGGLSFFLESFWEGEGGRGFFFLLFFFWVWEVVFLVLCEVLGGEV